MIKNKILLIDDELTLRETIQEILIFENYDVISVASGQEALDLLDNWIPDLIICDIMMPVMDGYMFLATIKEIDSLSVIPFIFLTAKKEDDLMRLCLLLGADDFLSKPFNISELIEVVDTKVAKFKKIKNTFNNLYVGEKKYLLHEVNTALNGILGSIDLLVEEKNDYNEENVKEFHDIIKLCGEHLNRTMHNLFLYQDIVNNEVVFLHKDIVNIEITFEIVLSRIKVAYKDAEERVISNLEKANIKINDEYLDFILYELVENALKFSGTSSVSVVGKLFNTKYYILVIKDSGIGFNQEDLKKIGAGQQFQRNKREQQGLGLGLFLSRTILKKSKGIFIISSVKNKGTEVTLFFPIVE